jgi:hypothetical protein
MNGAWNRKADEDCLYDCSRFNRHIIRFYSNQHYVRFVSSDNASHMSRKDIKELYESLGKWLLETS